MDLKKILKLLNDEERKKLKKLLALTSIMAILDASGVASIVPFMAVLSNPDILTNNIYLSGIYKQFHFRDVNEFLLILGFAVFALTLLSLTLKAFTNYLQLHFSLFCEFSISRRLVEGYLNQPYEWFLSHNSADLGRKIVSEVNVVVFNALLPIMNIFTQGMIVIALLALLIFASPLLAAVTGGTLIGTYLLIYVSQRSLLVKFGTESNKANGERFLIISETFGAFKEIKLGMFEKIYLDDFTRSSKNFANSQAAHQVAAQMPRYALELISIGGLLVIMLFLMTQEKAFSDVLPIVALYAFAGYRLMPSLQQIYHSLSQVKYSKSSTDILYSDINNMSHYKNLDKPTSSICLTDSIQLSDIKFSYHQKSKLALNGISLNIKANSSIGIVGSTGGGKTTLVDIILGLLTSKSGHVSVDGQIIGPTNLRLWQNVIGYVPQQIYLTDNTLAANIAFGLPQDQIDFTQVERVSKIACLHEFIEELPDGYYTTIGERGVRLSGGQRQRIGIARALYHNPSVLILDEATSSLDGITESLVMDAIYAIGNTVTLIIIAHRISTIKHCDNIYILENGEIKDSGTYDNLLSRNEYFKKLIQTTT